MHKKHNRQYWVFKAQLSPYTFSIQNAIMTVITIGVKSRQAFFSLLICLITCLLDILIGFIWKENINIDRLGLKRVIIIIIIWVAL